MTDEDKQKVNAVDINNQQIIINKFLNLQSKLIKKQHQTGRKINGKRAFINFLLPNLNNKKAIDKNNSSYWKKLHQEVQSKPVEEYTVDDIVFENTDYLLEYQIVNQSLKTKLRITIKSCFNINNQTLYSNLILDIWGLNDIKAIQNQINILNNKNNAQEIVFQKHNIQVIENTITNEQQNIVFQIKQNPIINLDDNDDFKYDSTMQFQIIQDTQFLNKFDITKILSRVELDILSKLDKNSNQSIIYSTYKDFFQKFNVEDFFVSNQTDNLVDIHVTYLDLFWYQKRIRYNVQKNWIDYTGLSDSDRTKNNESILHHMFDNNYYQTHRDFQDNYDDFKNKLDNLSQTALPLKDLLVLISEHVSVNIYAPLKYSFYIESKMMENGGLYGYRSVLNNMKNNSYLNYLLLSSLSKKHKQGINRCKLFYYYVLFFNPEFKNLWNSGLLQIINIVSEEYFYSIFNLFSLVSQKYPNLMKNLDKYLSENKGLFPILIYHPISEINNDPNNLLSYKKNQSLFDSKNQFHLLNKKKSSLLTKLYLFCLSKHNNDLSENCVFHNEVSPITDTYYPNYEVDSNINRIYTHCLQTTYQHKQERKHNLLLNLFWKMVSDNQVSNRQLYFALSLCVKLFIFNFNKIEQMFGYQTTKLMFDIVSLHFYKQILLIIQNKTDWRSSFHEICNSNHPCLSLNRDAFIFYDFLVDIYSRYQCNEKLQFIVDKSNYKVDLDFINHYEDSVQKCLTADMENNAFIINLINDRLNVECIEGYKEMLIFAFDKKIKLFPNSTFESIREYINNINQFYLRQEQIASHQVKHYTYSSYNYQEHQFELKTINMGDVCFEPILNSGRLIEEGVNMEHCVASYDYKIMNDKFLVYHITDKTSYPSKSLEKTHILKELTLGLSLDKNLFNQIINANPKLNNVFNEYYLNNDKTNSNANHNNFDSFSFVKLNQCYGYKNAVITNPEQNENIGLLVNKLIVQLNQQLVNIIKAHQQTKFNHNK